MVMALVLGGGMNVVAYYFSDKIALATMRAREVSREEEPGLVGLVEELARRAGLPMPRVCICPQEAPNAFATGRNPSNAVVAVTEGLLRVVDRNELSGVLAHELGHIKHRDILIQTVAATVAGAISALGYLLWFVPMGSGGGNRRGGNALVALAMIILAPIAAMLLQLAISRKREYNADSFGAEVSGDPRYLASALVKLHQVNSRVPMQVAMDSQKNMFIVEPFTGREVAKLFNTHPALEDRLEALIGRKSL
jgi:heat shock protein HtpX